MSDELEVKCELCDNLFEPTPDSFVEWELGGQWVKEEEVEDKGIPMDELLAMPEFDLKTFGLTLEDQSALSRGETVKRGGCICPKCMDEEMTENPNET